MRWRMVLFWQKIYHHLTQPLNVGIEYVLAQKYNRVPLMLVFLVVSPFSAGIDSPNISTAIFTYSSVTGKLLIIPSWIMFYHISVMASQFCYMFILVPMRICPVVPNTDLSFIQQNSPLPHPFFSYHDNIVLLI